MRRSHRGLAALCAAAAIAGRAEASPPSPLTSYVDPCIVVCPAGDFSFRVVARRASGIPASGAWVQLELCGCPDVNLVSNPAAYSVTDGCWVSRAADASGLADIPLAAGGICSETSIRVFADGVLLAIRTAVASPDRDGDLVVNPSDLARLQGKLGTADPSADFDCSGQVSEADLSVAEAHLGHAAAAPVGVPGETEAAVAMLGQNRPNPFSGISRIYFRLPRPERVTLTVFDARGRQVAVLLRDAALPAGSHQVPFDGRGLVTGIYLYQLKTASFQATRKMTLLR